MTSFDPLGAQRKLMSTWGGRALDDLGLLRVLNDNGSKAPLFWIFNAAIEARQLSEVLGADQPLVFSRSAHLLAPPGDDPMPIRHALTAYLAQEIAHHFAGVTFDLGTSCQGAPMAMQLARGLPENGVGVGYLCLINSAIPDVPTQRPALLVYGDQDQTHDPFSQDAAGAHQKAMAAHSSYKRVVLSAGHGQFYHPTTLADIFAQFAAFKGPSDAASLWMKSANSSTVG